MSYMNRVVASWHLHDEYGIPIILLGEDSSDEILEKVVKTETDLYLVRSFGYRELEAEIKAIIRRYKGRKLKEAV